MSHKLIFKLISSIYKIDLFSWEFFFVLELTDYFLKFHSLYFFILNMFALNWRKYSLFYNIDNCNATSLKLRILLWFNISIPRKSFLNAQILDKKRKKKKITLKIRVLVRPTDYLDFNFRFFSLVLTKNYTMAKFDFLYGEVRFSYGNLKSKTNMFWNWNLDK